MPRLPSGAMNRDSIIAASADCACEMKIFSPLSIHSPVSRSKVAVVRMFAGSDPAPGSVIAIAIVCFFHFSICSGVATVLSTVLPSPHLLRCREIPPQ